MALSVDELTTLRDALVRARARGVTSVQTDGNSITYKSDAEMAAAIKDLTRQINEAGSQRASAIRFSSSKGL